MAFTDEIKIKAKAGNGGNGVVRWLHEKDKEWSGPAGGDGGKGGDIYLHAVRNAHLLSKYKSNKEFKAEDGGDGFKKSQHGKDGDDLYIELPIGSVITDVSNGQTNGKKIFLNTEDEKIILLKGGRGGRGNEHFKSSTNQSPEESTEGKPGVEGEFEIELELIADIGFIGLPNAGKTSLLNELTRSTGKVGDYPFTTLEPNLGEMHGFIIADIPGLIEGAHEGKGLGHKFLRHIKRTRILVHLVSLENENIIETYKIIKEELNKFDPELNTKKEIILLTKSDIIEDKKNIEKSLKDMEIFGKKVFAISAYNDEEIKNLRDILIKEATE
jgi:GTP-binding protein